MTRAVLHVCEPIDGGAAAVVHQLVRDQVERGWTVTVAGPTAGPLLERAAAGGALVAPWEAVGGPGPSVPGEVRRLRGVIDAVAPDLVHLHSSKAGLAGRLALRGSRPTIFQPHGWSFRVIDGVRAAAALRWERFAGRWAVIVNVSEAERRRGAVVGIDSTSFVIPNAVDTDRFAFADDAARAAARDALGLTARPLAVCVARMTGEKGHDVLLEAWNHVREQVPDATLALVGDGPLRADLEARADASVRFVGEIDDVRPWLAASDVVALPSYSEGMSLSVLEALAVGRSIVATDVDGAREEIGDVDDSAGAIVPIADSSAFGGALIQRLVEPAVASAEGECGRSRAEARFDLRRWGDRFADLVDRVLDAPAAGFEPTAQA